MNTPLGATELEENRDDFTHECWVSWSPTWRFSEAEFAATAKSFHNPDWVATTLNCYRTWYGNAPGNPTRRRGQLPQRLIPVLQRLSQRSL
jgi:hypothetical protein